MTVYQKMKTVLYGTAKYREHKEFRKWAKAWLQGKDRTLETAERLESTYGQTTSAMTMLFKAASNLARAEKDSKYASAYETAAQCLIESAEQAIQNEFELDFSFDKFLKDVSRYPDYVRPSETTDYRYLRGSFGRRKLSKAEFTEIAKEQKFFCAICHLPEFQCVNYGNGKNGLITDHDGKNPNEEKNVRGLICMRCKRMLGYAEDNPDILEEAASYLRYWTHDRQR